MQEGAAVLARSAARARTRRLPEAAATFTRIAEQFSPLASVPFAISIPTGATALGEVWRRLGNRIRARGPAGSRREFGALPIATGAEPIQLPIPGAETTEVRYLRTFADSRAIVARARSAKHVLVVGASFIGLEVNAALPARGLAVTVVAPESRPLVRVMGDELGAFVQRLHEARRVAFRLGKPWRRSPAETSR